MTAQQRYVNGCAAFESAPDDSPEAIPYYRAAAGLRAAWGETFCTMYNHLYHGAFCATAGPDQGGPAGYARALAHLRWAAESATLPERPRSCYWYEQEPQPPTESDARALFVREYKVRFPGNRANGRHAREQWEKLRPRAFEIVTERYRAKLAEYNRRKDEHDAREAEITTAWAARCEAIETMVRDIRGILKTEDGGTT